jgi:hypothetical protein
MEIAAAAAKGVSDETYGHGETLFIFVTGLELLHEKQRNEKPAFIYTKNYHRHFIDGRFERRHSGTAEYDR